MPIDFVALQLSSDSTLQLDQRLLDRGQIRLEFEQLGFVMLKKAERRD